MYYAVVEYDNIVMEKPEIFSIYFLTLYFFIIANRFIIVFGFYCLME